MKKVYFEPNIAVERFGSENIITVSVGEAIDPDDVTAGGYAVKTIDADSVLDALHFEY